MAVASINVGFQVNVKELADKLNQAAAKLEEHKARFEEIGNAIGKAGMYVGRYVDQMAGTVISTIGGVVSFIPEIVSGISKLNAVIAANPWIALATVITAAGTALYFFTRKGSEAAQMQKMLNDVNAEALKNTAKERAELDSLLVIAQDEMAMKKDRLDAIKKLNEISPQYLGNINLETINTKKAAEAIEQYIDVLNSKAREQALMAKKTELYQKQIEEESSDVQRFQAVADGLSKSFGGQAGAVITTRKQLEEYIKQLKLTKDQATTFRNAYERQLQILEKGRVKYQSKIDILDNYAKAERKNTSVVKDSSQNTISYYEEQIKSLQKLQKETAKSPDQYSAIQKQIDEYKSKISDIEGGASVSKQSTKHLETIKVDTIKFYESQISELKKHQNEQALTADEFNAIAVQIEAIQQKIDAITGKRQKATTVTVDYSPAIEGSTVALEKQIKTLEKQREAIRVVFGEANIAYQALSNQIKDIEFKIKIDIEESGLNLNQFKASYENFQSYVESQSQISSEAIRKEQENAQMYAGIASDAFVAFGDSFVQSMGEAQNGLEYFGQAMMQAVIKIIAMGMAQSMSNTVVIGTESAKGFGPMAAFVLPGLIAAAMAAVMGAYSQVPKFADGGVVYGPTLGLMGEYAGATNNPEVIAPLNKLRDLIEPAGGGETQIFLGGRLAVSGSELQLVLDRYATKSKRTG